MDAYEQFLQQTVGPAVKLRDYIIDLKKQVERLGQDAARYRALRKNACMSLPSPEGCEHVEAYLVVTGCGDEKTDAIVDKAVDSMI